MEIWKNIEGYEDYTISITGIIKKGNTILKPYHNKKDDSHLKIKLTKDGVRKAFYVHQLVAKAFLPNPDNLSEVNHIDHNPENNSVTNLEWCSHLENTRDAAEFRKTKNIIENPHFDFVNESLTFTKKQKAWIEEL